MEIKVEPAVSNKKYPYIGTMDGWVVLFTGPRAGVCLVSGGTAQSGAGEYNVNWSESSYEPFRGKVTITV